MPIPSIEEIYGKANSMGLKAISAISLPGPETVMRIDLIINENDDSESLEVFLQLVKDLGQTFFFMDVTIYDEELCKDYLIDLDEISEDLYGSSFKSVKKASKDHNKLIESFPKDKPVYIELFVYSQGCLYSKDFSEEWFTQLIDPKEALRNIGTQYEDNINTFRVRQEQLNLSKRKDLENEIISDPVFKACSTKAARMAFVEQFFKEHGEELPRIRAGLDGWCDLLLAKSKTKINI